MFEIAKDSSRIQPGMNLGVECALTFMDEMMNGETGHHRIEVAELGKRILEIVGHDHNGGITCETLACGVQHGWREIYGYRSRVRIVQFDQRKQPSIAGAEIEDAPCGRRNDFEKCGFAFDPVWNRVCAAQVVQRVFG